MVAHGRLKHLNGGHSLDNGKKVGLLAQEWPRSFQPSCPEQFGIHPSPSRGSLDRISPSRDSAVWRLRVSLVAGDIWNQSASACLTSCSSRKDNHTGRERRGDPDGLCPACGKPGGGHRGKIKARSVEYQQPRAVKIIYGGILFAVVANRFHGAAFQGFLTGAQLFVVVRLLLDIGYSFIVIPSKVFWSRFAAKVTVNAGTVHVKFAGDV